MPTPWRLPRANLSVKVTRADAPVASGCAERRCTTRDRRLGRCCAWPCASWRPSACRHGVGGLARGDRSRWCSSCSATPSSRRAVGWHRLPGLPARLARASSIRSSRGLSAPAPSAADRASGQGRLLGPRGRGGAPARLGAAGLRAPGRLRPQLRAAARGACSTPARACGSRSAPTTCARSPTRSPGAAARWPERDLELQVLRGLGDDLATRSPPHGLRVRVYCAGRRPRRRHGLPRPAPAREHLQRLVPSAPAQARRRRPAGGAVTVAAAARLGAVRERVACSSCAAPSVARRADRRPRATSTRGCRFGPGLDRRAPALRRAS